MPYADTATLDYHIVDILNAAATWSGAVTAGIRSAEAIENARQQSSLRVIAAIASNPQAGYFGDLSEWVAIEHGAFLPARDNQAIGVPRIVPFEGAPARSGLPADPDEIDSWRNSPASYAGTLDGTVVAHDKKDAANKMFPYACRYSLVASEFKFTGLTAEIPVLVISDAMYVKVPLALAPTVVSGAIPLLVKPGDALYLISREYATDAKQDLIEIAGGAMRVKPFRSVADIVSAQKMAV